MSLTPSRFFLLQTFGTISGVEMAPECLRKNQVKSIHKGVKLYTPVLRGFVIALSCSTAGVTCGGLRRHLALLAKTQENQIPFITVQETAPRGGFCHAWPGVNQSSGHREPHNRYCAGSASHAGLLGRKRD